MKYVATTYDEQMYSFDSQFLPLVEKAMEKKTGIKLKGILLNGADIRRVEPEKSSKNYGPHSGLSAVALDMFSLPSGEKTVGFWEIMLGINRVRKSEGKLWLFPSVVDKARSQTSFTRPQDLADFIDSEYASYQEYNLAKFPVDAVAKAMAREYSATESGREYMSKWPARG